MRSHHSYWLLAICLSIALSGHYIAADDSVSHLSGNGITTRSLQSTSEPPPGGAVPGELVDIKPVELANNLAEERGGSSSSGRLHLFFVLVSFLGNAAFMVFVFWLSK
jgi:hypothetical protein